MKFRERDGVCVTYDVSGQSDDGEFPYVNDLPTLKEAVAIAKTYPGIYEDGSATHITRRFAKLYPPGSKFHHHAGRTHRWRVSSEGKLMLDVAYSRPWKTTRIGMSDYCQSLPKPPMVAETLQGQLRDLAVIAGHIGMLDAEKELLAQVFPWKRKCSTKIDPTQSILPTINQT